MSEIRSQPATKEYRKNWDKVFKGKQTSSLLGKYKHIKTSSTEFVDKKLEYKDVRWL